MMAPHDPREDQILFTLGSLLVLAVLLYAAQALFKVLAVFGVVEP